MPYLSRDSKRNAIEKTRNLFRDVLLPEILSGSLIRREGNRGDEQPREGAPLATYKIFQEVEGEAPPILYCGKVA